MGFENFERKRAFVTRSLSQCVSEMFPHIKRLEYAFRMDGISCEAEEVRILHDCGYTSCIDVTGLELLPTARKVLDALDPEVI